MLKLKRYLKPYIALFLGAIILLFGQALLELTLPNYMSDIVNVGLQQGGITYSAPDAIDAQSMQLMQLFMSEEDRATIDGVYTQLSEGEQLTELQKTFPKLQPGTTPSSKSTPEESTEPSPAPPTHWYRPWNRWLHSLDSRHHPAPPQRAPSTSLRSVSCSPCCKTQPCRTPSSSPFKRLPSPRRA